jgi:hypothetical protein
MPAEMVAARGYVSTKRLAVTYLTDAVVTDRRFEWLERPFSTEHDLCMAMPGNPPFNTAFMIQMYLIMCEAFPAKSVYSWAAKNEAVLMAIDTKVTCSVLSSSAAPRRAANARVLSRLNGILGDPRVHGTEIVIMSKGCGSSLWEREFKELAAEQCVELNDVRLVSADMVAWDGRGGKVLAVHPDAQVFPQPTARISVVSLGLFRAPPKTAAANIRSLMKDTLDGGCIICSEDLAGKKAIALVQECVMILAADGLAEDVEYSELDGVVLLSWRKKRCHDNAAEEAAYLAAEARVNEIVDARTTTMDVDTCGGETMKIVDHNGTAFHAKDSGVYVIEYQGRDEGWPVRSRLAGMPSCYCGGSRTPAWRILRSMLERTEKAGFKGNDWRAFLVWHIGLLHSSTRKLPLTIRHLDLMVHVQETINLVLNWDFYNLNFSQNGLTSASSLGSLLGGAFCGGFNLDTYEAREKIILTWPGIEPAYREELLLALRYQREVVSIFQGTYNLKSHAAKHDSIDLLDIDEDDKAEKHKSLSNISLFANGFARPLAVSLTRLGTDEFSHLTGKKTEQFTGSLHNMDLFANGFARPLADSLTRLGTDEFSHLTGKKTEQFADSLRKTVVICKATKTGAEMLTAAATTPQERQEAAKAMAKVSGARKHDVTPEEDRAAKLYAEIADLIPAFAGRQASKGNFWLDMQVPSREDRFSFLSWLGDLSTGDRNERLDYVFRQKAWPAQALITPFREAIAAHITQNQRFQRDQSGTSTKLDKDVHSAAAGSMTNAAISFFGAPRGSAAKKPEANIRRTRRTFTPSNLLEFESLLTAGKLQTTHSRFAEATRISTETGNPLSLTQLTNWVRKHKQR